jgi:tetratricopeptide (TPR) repeat protein
VAVALAGLAAYLVVQGFRQEGLRKQAEVVYGEGLNRYRKAGKDDRSADKQQDYEAALKAFREVIEKYDKTAYARQSEVMGYLCRSYLDILAGDWAAMERDAGMADQRITDFQRRSDLRQFAQQAKQDLTEMREYWQDSKRFAEAIAQAREAEANADFDRADALLVEQAGQYAKQSDRIALIQAMRQAIAEKKKQGEYQTWVKRGDEARKNKKTDEARAGYLKALDILEQSKGSLARNVYDDLKKAAQAKLDVLDKEVRYAAAMAEVAKAIKAGSKLAAADAMKQALLIRPDDPDRLKDQIPTLEHDYWIDQGRKELDANNLPAAETAYKNARAAKPSPEAQAGLDRIQSLRNYQSVRREGDRLFQEKSWAAALQKYNQALALVPAEKRDKDLALKMTDCQFNLAMEEAQAYRSKKEWDQALAVLSRAKQIKPSEGALVDDLAARISTERLYTEKMDAAERARQKRSWSEAVKLAQEAKGIRDTPEAGQLLGQIRYEQHLEMGKAAMAGGDYTGALAYFKLAKGFKPAEEVDRLIEKCLEELKKEGGS